MATGDGAGRLAAATVTGTLGVADAVTAITTGIPVSPDLLAGTDVVAAADGGSVVLTALRFSIGRSIIQRARVVSR